MSLLYKRTGSPFWYVTKTRESTRTANRKHAEEFARKSLTARWRSEALGEVTHTWDTLCTEWLDHKSGAASLVQDSHVIERFTELLTRRKVEALGLIDGELIAAYGKSVRLAGSPATANRHFTTIRAMLNRARENGWISVVPLIRNYDLPTKEPRWLTLAQFETLLPLMPQWVSDMATVAVHTGMRFSNVAGLKWEWISSDIITVPAVNAKTGRTYTVPMSDDVKIILANRLHFQKQSPRPFVFSGFVQGSPGKFDEPPMVEVFPVHRNHVGPHWKRATRLAGFPGFRWHDLRHTWASLHTQNGTPDRVLKEMGGWASTRMLETYAHLSTKHLVEYANNFKKEPANVDS